MKAAIEAETLGQSSAVTLEEINRDYAQNRESVIDMLVDKCMTVDKEIPRVVRGNFENMEDA